VTLSSLIWPVNGRAGYRRPARQRRGPGPWCLRSSPKRRKASATATHTRPLRCPSHHLENPCNVLVGWVSEPQKRHRKRDNAGTAMASLPRASRALALPLPSPPKAASQRQYSASAPGFSYLRLRAALWPQPQPPGFLASRHDKRRAGRGRKAAAARAKLLY
jgi:hypothetical protein